MALDTEKRDPRDIDESAHIPNGGFIGEEETSTYVYLPTYNFTLSHEFSSSNHLTLTDCHIAMKATLHKARLIIFEIARQNRPFHRRHLKKIILSGSIRDLDKNLSSTSSDLDGLLSIGTYVYGHSRLHDLLMNSLVAHESFKDSSSTYNPCLRQHKDINTLCSETETIIPPLRKGLRAKCASNP